MLTKAEKTTQFIIETVAPIFNRNGYEGTSMSDITAATGLTKGAIYGNFENKEQLALVAFKYNIKRLLSEVEDHINQGNTPLDKLFKLTDFYRNYYDFSKEIGGCPILNVGVDSNSQNPLLAEKVKQVIDRMQTYIENLINEGKEAGQIKKTIISKTYAKRFYSLLQGAVFMSQTMKDNSYVIDAANVINDTMKMYFKN